MRARAHTHTQEGMWWEGKERVIGKKEVGREEEREETETHTPRERLLYRQLTCFLCFLASSWASFIQGRVWDIQPYMGHLYNTPASQGSGSLWKKGYKDSSQCGGWLQGNTVFQAQGSCMYDSQRFIVYRWPCVLKQGEARREEGVWSPTPNLGATDN